MSERNITCDIDRFAATIVQLIGDIPAAGTEAMQTATAKATRKGAKTVKEYAQRGGLHDWSKEYVNGFSSHVTKGEVVVGEIGNKNKPGLVHLLEKGHLTPAGRRTRAYPHMAPAFNEIQDDFIKQAEKALGRMLK